MAVYLDARASVGTVPEAIVQPSAPVTHPAGTKPRSWLRGMFVCPALVPLEVAYCPVTAVVLSVGDCNWMSCQFCR